MHTRRWWPTGPTEPGFRGVAAREEIVRCAGTQFDPAVVEAFMAEVQAAEGEQTRDPVRDAAEHVRALLGEAR